MLKNLSVWNFALIEKAELEFGEGLNILTGETGAGKSILTDALGAVLGQRIGTNQIRTGCDHLRVEGVFLLENNSAAHKILNELDIDDDDGTLIIARKFFRAGRSSIIVNGTHITLASLKRIGTALVDIHGQNENLALLREDSIYNLIDNSDAKIPDVRDDYQRLYRSWTSKVRTLDEKQRAKFDNEQRLDMLRWQEQEISQADLKPDEDTELETEIRKLSHAEKISDHVAESCNLLEGDSDFNILSALSKVIKNLDDTARYDDKLNSARKLLEDAEISLREAYSEISNYSDSLDFSPERLEELHSRLDIIHRLKKKYGNSVTEILERLNKIRTEISAIEHFDSDVESARKLIAKLETQTRKRAEILLNARREAARKLSTKIEAAIRRLGMQKAKFFLKVDATEILTARGGDKADMIFSANVGEDLQSLSKIISGGELSRVALAIKTVSAGRDDSAATMVFDEIDTGLGGITAKVVAECIAKVSRHKQVLCITHLAQIACMADVHLLITKTDNNRRTVTTVKILSDDERVREIARMATGSETAEAVKTAQTMIISAKQF